MLPQAKECQKLEEERKDSPLKSSERKQLTNTLILNFLNSRSVREQMSVVSTHQVCGTLLQQPLETNADTLWAEIISLHLSPSL